MPSDRLNVGRKVYIIMRIEKLEFNKVKITLFSEDLQMYNINVKKINPDSPELHTFLCEMMKIVSSQTNFNPFDGQVIVEATPSEDGLVLMLSKIDENVPAPKRIKAVKKKRKEYICHFESFNALGDFFKANNQELKNAAVYAIGEEFYLAYHSDKPILRIKEFCEIGQSSGLGRHYLDEHGRLIADGEKLDNIINYFKEE